MLKVSSALQYVAHLEHWELQEVCLERLDVRKRCHSSSFGSVCPFHAQRLPLSCAAGASATAALLEPCRLNVSSLAHAKVEY